MATIERLGNVKLAEDEQAELERSLGHRAADVTERWINFTKNREVGFLAYFMLEDDNHESIRQIFLDKVGGSLELPFPDEKIVLEKGNVRLRAFSNIYDDGKPYDVTYVGERFEPVQ
jgi:hypothetical protein